MKIGLIMQGGAGWPGGAEYIRNTAQAISVAEPGAAITVFHESKMDRAWLRSFPAETRFVPVPVYRGRFGRVLTGGNELLARAVRREGVGFLYPFTYENLWNIGVEFPIAAPFGKSRWAGWIPDFQHRHLPQLFRSEDRQLRDEGIGRLAAVAEKIVFSSETAAADYRAFFPEGRAVSEVIRFHTAPEKKWYAGNPEETRARLGVPERYFMVCNQFWQHKNHGVVIEALERLKNEGQHPVVVCTGATKDYRNPDYFPELGDRVIKAGLNAQWKVLGLVDRIDQIQLLRSALGVIQPSMSEGWSTVVEDARVLGKRVLLSALPVHREQNPPGARYFDAENADEMARIMGEAWEQWPAGVDRAVEAAAGEAGEIARLAFGKRVLGLAGKERQ
jgi:glycosyltransferase involved in cell wall biosynthesis